MQLALQIVAIIVSLALIVMVLLQVKGSGLGDLLGGSGETGGITRTRRGLEKTLYQITIGLAVVFIAICILAVSVVG
ncbi:MAG: preprotein translocase subunit SecG [Anaerolineae bacterium]|nr:preprotein translocase subunit SecG [Anaerolineae bacterium]MCK6577088.1 preprotein translocase subunit SecG [Anaerolineae bacterium]NUQ02406.1 preprotein translocase subunit SecG [Anaerolineae bacterium]